MDKTNDFHHSKLMSENLDQMSVLCGLLRAQLSITLIKQQIFPANWNTRDEIIVSHRILFVNQGALDYTIEGHTVRIAAGEQFFVPAWCRREWSTAAGCGLQWCEFSSESTALPPVLWRRLFDVGEQAIEEAALLRMQRGSEYGLVVAEGELKAIIARFFDKARPAFCEWADARQQHRHPEIANAINWLERHHADSQALDILYGKLLLSPNHFRLIFRQQTGETVQAMLGRLRMRRARYLVRETILPLKRVAAMSGFDDPLYFSRKYKQYWGLPATSDRVAGGIA